jgi:hypothetical protein
MEAKLTAALGERLDRRRVARENWRHFQRSGWMSRSPS